MQNEKLITNHIIKNNTKINKVKDFHSNAVETMVVVEADQKNTKTEVNVEKKMIKRATAVSNMMYSTFGQNDRLIRIVIQE